MQNFVFTTESTTRHWKIVAHTFRSFLFQSKLHWHWVQDSPHYMEDISLSAFATLLQLEILGTHLIVLHSTLSQHPAWSWWNYLDKFLKAFYFWLPWFLFYEVNCNSISLICSTSLKLLNPSVWEQWVNANNRLGEDLTGFLIIRGENHDSYPDYLKSRAEAKPEKLQGMTVPSVWASGNSKGSSSHILFWKLLKESPGSRAQPPTENPYVLKRIK